jgi:hypothetical protein
MATYLQGVQDYIPQFQPFQPDLNLYANVLQTKQTQYDTAWKSLNNVYGQYFYADLTRDNNIARKEEILKNIDFNIKKISGLDLSLEENVSKASQIFKPFYEDEYLMKDMAWTKNYVNQKSRAEGLKNSLNDKMREQYWDGGVRALDYMREEFKEVADQESLNFQNSSYTPYLNSVKKAQEIAKEAGLSVEPPPEFSEDGRWIIKKKNGEALIEPLSKLFEATLGNDPAIQAVYKTQAYLDRKDYAYSNAGQFGGDKNAAEMKYLEESYTQLKQDNEKRYKQLQSNSNTYTTKIKEIETLIKNKKAGPDAEQRLAQLKEGKDINDNIINRIDKDNEAMKNQSGTPATSSGFQNPYGDIKSLRWKVDNARASSLMQKDLNEAAYIFSFKDAKTDIEANPYAVNEQKHAFSMQEVAARNKGLERAARIRNEGEAKNKMSEYLVKSGVAEYDVDQYIQDEDGNLIANPNFMQAKMKPEAEFQFKEKIVDGSVTDNLKKIDVARKGVKNQTNEFGVPYLTNMVESIDRLRKNDQISEDELKYIFEKFPGMTTKKMMSIVKNGNLDSFLMFSNDPWKAKDLAYRFQNVLKDNKDLPDVQIEMQKMQPYTNKFFDYTDYLNNQQTFFKASTKEVETELKRQGFKGADYLYNNKGQLRSENEFYKAIPDYLKKKYENYGGSENAGGISGIGSSPSEQMKLINTSFIKSSLSNNFKKELNYKELTNAASSIWSSGKVKAPVVGIKGEGSAQAVDERNSIMVYPSGPSNLPGKLYTSQFAKDFRNIDFDNINSVISFTGASKTAYDNNKMTDDNSKWINKRTNARKALVNAIFAEMANSQSKMKQFKLSSQEFAAGNANKSAMIITPDAEWLKTYMGKVDKEGKYAGLYTEDDYNNLLRNGITVISDANNFTNGLYKSGKMTQFESNVNYLISQNKSYTEKSPYDNQTYFSISKNEYGTGDYTISTNYRSWDPNTNSWGEVINQETVAGGSGFSLDGFRETLQQEFIKLNMKNTELKNL